jgi:predicted Zn-dependent peptidase
MPFLCHYLFLFSLWLSFFSAPLWAQTRTDLLTRYQITELTLKNGMRICLKQSKLEPGEFDFQLFALGGFASLPTADQPSGWLAAEIAWESGLDQHTGDELECALDDHSIEMQIKLERFGRQIEATGPTTEIDFCLQLTRLIFTNPRFNEEGFKEALAHARHHLQQRAKENQLIDGEIFTKVNLRNWYTIAHFNLLDLNKIELKKAKDLFNAFFSNPAEFMLVLVGDFNPQEIIPLLEASLGSLPTYPVKKWDYPTPPAFPEGITKKEISGVTRYKTSHTHLTFPLSTQMIDPVTHDLLCSILKQRFLTEAAPNEQWRKDIVITHEFPLFPYMQPLWLIIKFTSSVSEVYSISQSILTTLENIKRTGISEKEFKTAYLELIANKPTSSDNAYDLSLLANYYRAGWDVLKLYELSDQEKQEKMMLKKVWDCYPNLNQYSIISLHP